MFQAKSLLFSLFLALYVCATPVVVRENFIRLPFSKKVNVTGIQHIIKSDRARAAQLRLSGQEVTSRKAVGVHPRALPSVPVENQAVTYAATVGVGSPPTEFSLIVDTGSSNTWVGAQAAFTSTKTSHESTDIVEVVYGSGAFLGIEYTDQVTMGGLVIKSQSIGVAAECAGFSGVDGILGLGPVGLTFGTLSPESNKTIPTVTDSLFSQGSIPSHVVGISFEPTTVNDVSNGEITFGGTDSSKFTGSITFTPLTTISPASAYWGIDQSVSYGKTEILSTTGGIVDTGTTLVLIASDALAQYQELTGAVLDDEFTGLLTVTPTQFSNLQSLFFNVAGTSFELTANAQAWPRSLNTVIGGTSDTVYLIVGDLGVDAGSGMDFINGLGFLERFYSVFDTANNRVGLATTPFTHATTN